MKRLRVLLVTCLMAAAAVAVSPQLGASVPEGCELSDDNMIVCLAHDRCLSDDPIGQNPRVNFDNYGDDHRFNTAPYRGGDVIHVKKALDGNGCWLGSRCSTAFSVWDQDIDRYYATTAAHCIASGDGTVPDYGRVWHADGTYIGFADQSRLSEEGDNHDVARVRFASQTNVRWGSKFIQVGTQRKGIAGIMFNWRQKKGVEVCHNGVSTGTWVDRPFTVGDPDYKKNCGPIEETSKDSAGYEDLRCFRAFGGPGDSGAAVFSLKEDKVELVGIVSSIYYESKGVFNKTVDWDKPHLICYTPAITAINQLGVRIVK